MYSQGVKQLLTSHSRAYVMGLSMSLALLCGAWIFQYGFGYPPCQMCYWQRHAHKVVIGLSLFAIVSMALAPSLHRVKISYIWGVLIALALIGSAIVAFWHMGVEYKWWEGPKGCVAGAFNASSFSGTDLLGSLDQKIKPPSCDKALWHFLGLSMAAWNGILSSLTALAVIGLTFKKPKQSLESTA